VGGDSDRRIQSLRSQARSLGITIRLQRASRRSSPRAYRLIDRATGTVIYANVPLDEVHARLRLVMLERQRRQTNRLRAAKAPTEHCPLCGTLRIGYFRWCTSCGLDYEATVKSNLASGSWSQPLSAIEKLWSTPRRPAPIQSPRRPEPRPPRIVRLRRAIGRRLGSASLSEVAVAILLAVLIGVIVSIAASTK